MSRSAWTSWNIVPWRVPFCFTWNYDSWQIKIVMKIQFSSVYLLKWIVWGIRNKSRPVNQTCFCDDGPGFSKWEPKKDFFWIRITALSPLRGRELCNKRGHQQQLQCASSVLSTGTQTATSVCKYFDFEGGTNSNSNV